MADGNSKRIKLEPKLEVSQPDATEATVKPSLFNMRHGDLIKEVQEERNRNEQLKAAFTRNLDVVIKHNQELTTERDSLLQQLQQEMSKGNVPSKQQGQQPEQLQQFVVKIQELSTEWDSLRQQLQEELSNSEVQSQQQLRQPEKSTERLSLLHQLQQEMSKSEALRQQLNEMEQSQQSILDSLFEQSTIRVEELLKQIDTLKKEVDNLTRQLDYIKEENTCAICLSPWEAQGDHRIVSLPCGHLFGKECIRACLVQKSECPLCKQEVQSGGVRYIFGCRVLPVRSPQALPSQAVRGAPAAQPNQFLPVQLQQLARQQAPAAQSARRPVHPAPNHVQSVSRPAQPALSIPPSSVSHHAVQDGRQPTLRMPVVLEQQPPQPPPRQSLQPVPRQLLRPSVSEQQPPQPPPRQSLQPAPRQHLQPASSVQLASRAVQQASASQPDQRGDHHAPSARPARRSRLRARRRVVLIQNSGQQPQVSYHTDVRQAILRMQEAQMASGLPNTPSTSRSTRTAPRSL